MKGVTIKGERPLFRMSDDAFVTLVEGSFLSKIGTGNDVLAHIPGVIRNGNSIEVIGRGAPLIYINGRQMRNQNELDQLSSDQIKDVEVVMTPGAKYDATVKAVISAMTGESRGGSRAAAPGCGFSRGTTARSVSLS